MSLSRNATSREFQRHGPATEKLLSLRCVRVLLVAHVKTSADHSDQWLVSVKSWQSSARYCGSWPCNALYTRTAKLKSMRCRTGNQCNSRRTGVICSRLPVLVIRIKKWWSQWWVIFSWLGSVPLTFLKCYDTVGLATWRIPSFVPLIPKCRRKSEGKLVNIGPVQLASKIGKRMRAALGCHLMQTIEQALS